LGFLIELDTSYRFTVLDAKDRYAKRRTDAKKYYFKAKSINAKLNFNPQKSYINMQKNLMSENQNMGSFFLRRHKKRNRFNPLQETVWF